MISKLRRAVEGQFATLLNFTIGDDIERGDEILDDVEPINEPNDPTVDKAQPIIATPTIAILGVAEEAASATARIHYDDRCDAEPIGDLRTRFSKRTRKAPVDIYTPSGNIPEIEMIVPFEGGLDKLQELTTIKGPLPLGKQVAEAHVFFAIEASEIFTYTIQGDSILDRSGRIVLTRIPSGWIDPKTQKQVYDNKGNTALEPDADFQISRICLCEQTDMFKVEFSDWTHLAPLDMHWNQITNKGRNEYMVNYLKYLRKYVNVGKWQSVGGKKKKENCCFDRRIDSSSVR
jgi:hypothetical protein